MLSQQTIVVILIIYVMSAMAVFVHGSVASGEVEVSDECNECIEPYCIVDCNGTSDRCGECVQRWCAYQC